MVFRPLMRWLGTSVMALGALTSCGRIGFDLLDLTSADVRDGGTHDARPGDDAGDAATQERDARSGVADAHHEQSPESGPEASILDGARDASSPVDAMSDIRSPPDVGPPATDSAPPVDAHAADSGSLACDNPKVWILGFDSDPTLVDSDHDGVFDWVVRNATTFPVAELSAGIWHSTTGIVLDSRPMDPFSSRTVVDVRMQSLSVPASGRGAVFWVNLNENQPAFSALFVNVMLEAGGGQTLALYGKVGTTETVLASFTNLPEAMVDIHLDIDPVTLSVALVANGVARGSYAIPVTGAPNTDHFATVLAWDGTADFDFVRIQRCPP
jgi:hypothetical protein